MSDDIKTIDLDNKYQFIETEGFKLKCKRYNEPWRDFIGDKAIHRLFSHAIELEAKAKLFDEALVLATIIRRLYERGTLIPECTAKRAEDLILETKELML